jgi:hypothetical protein
MTPKEKEEFSALRGKLILIGFGIWVLLLMTVQGAGNTMMVFMLGWLPIVAGHFMAKSMIEDSKQTAVIEQIKKEESLIQEEDRRERTAEKENLLSENRRLILDTFTAVNSYISSLSDPSCKDQATSIKNDIANELAGIVSKINSPDLKEVIEAHKEIQTKIRRLHARLKENFIYSDDIEDMMDLIPKIQTESTMVAGVARTPQHSVPTISKKDMDDLHF